MSSGLRKALDSLRHTLAAHGLTDAQLLQEFASNRDENAFAALVRRHGPMVLGVCRRILGNSADMDDAFQATFLVLVQQARKVIHREAIGSWLYTVAYRTALGARMANARRRQRERQVADMPHPEVKPAEPQDWQPLLDQELSRLPEKYRTPVILCDLEGKTRRQAAQQLGLAEGTLSGRLTAARRKLAQKLARHGITLSGGALAMAMSQEAASACVLPGLAATTVRAARLVAAGHLAAVSTPIVVLMKGAIKAMFIAKLKSTVAMVMVLAAIGAGSLVYCAAGGSGAEQPEKPPRSELEALKKENELLKLNLRITLEKIQAMEIELRALKGRGTGARSRDPFRNPARPSGADKDKNQYQKPELPPLTDKKDEDPLKKLPRPPITDKEDPDPLNKEETAPTAVNSQGLRAALGKDNIIEIIDLKSRRLLATIQAHTARVTALAFSADGKLLASGSQDKTVCLFDVATGKQLRRFSLANPVVSVSFLPDGTLISRDSNGKSRRWSVTTGREVKKSASP